MEVEQNLEEWLGLNLWKWAGVVLERELYSKHQEREISGIRVAEGE